ncbi:uncharacterized protein LOC132939716 [Metopolophium dirhodum]|uniref:uncharacterized protein LOC132939716 n=1 Tax=Metopolophium dirhodum TaxID=44670 RepID=UPI00298FDA81|nr:uncharacterized protein LOC132939716 [Metopolophium dirhodum]
MNTLVIGLSFSLICYLSGHEEKKPHWSKETMDLEALPLKKLLEMKKELRIKDERSVRRTDDEVAAVTAEEDAPNAMALRRTTDVLRSSAAGGSMQTAFQMSLTVLSFLAFGGYLISLVAQNMRKPSPSLDGATAPHPLKAVVVNRNKRPGLLLRPSGPTTTVSFGRRKRSRRFPRTTVVCSE